MAKSFMSNSIRSLLDTSSLTSFVEKLEDGTLSDKDVALFAVKQQSNIVLAGRLALQNALELQDLADSNAEKILNSEEPKRFYE